MSRVFAHLKHGFGLWFSADLRSLGLVRICIGFLCMWDILRRFEWIEVFYSNVGLLPNHFNLYRPFSSANISLLNAFSTPGEVTVFFVLALIAAFFFMVGYRTKLFHAITMVAIIGIHGRNIMLENGGDVVLNLWLMWTFFLPLGERYSVDALRRSFRDRNDKTPAQLNAPKVVERSRVWSLAVFAIIMQLVVIYLFNTLHKSGSAWRDGSALAWTLEQDRIVTGLGMFVRDDLPFWVTKFMTWGTLVIEGSAPLLLLSPFFPVWCRRLVIINLSALHIGIFLLTDVGLFSIDMMVIYPILLTAPDFVLLRKWFAKLAGERITVFYDSDCGVCHWCGRMLSRLDLLGRMTWVGRDPDAPLPPGFDAEQFEAERDRTIVAWGEKSNRVWTEEGAVVRILSALPLMRLVVWPLRLPGLSHAVGAFYRWFSPRRHKTSAWLGMGECGLSSAASAAPEHNGFSDARRSVRRAGTVVVNVVVAYMMVCCTTQLLIENRAIKKYYKHSQPSWAHKTVTYGRWFQGWGMFAPQPPMSDGALVIDALLEDGRHIDPQTGEPPVFGPPDATRQHWDQFWGSYSMRIASGRRKGNRPALRDWLKKPGIRHLKLDADQKIVGFSVWWIGDRSPDPRKGGDPVEKERYKVVGWRDSGFTGANK